MAPLVDLYKISQREHCETQADGTVRRVAFDDGAASLDDLRAESGADELFADEACTQPCTAADLVHGAVVYARHNAPEKEGDAMADEEEG